MIGEVCSTNELMTQRTLIGLIAAGEQMFAELRRRAKDVWAERTVNWSIIRPGSGRGRRVFLVVDQSNPFETSASEENDRNRVAAAKSKSRRT